MPSRASRRFIAFQNSSIVNSKRWMVPSMASGLVSGSSSASPCRSTARFSSSRERVTSSLKEDLPFGGDALAELGRRGVETHEVDRQQGLRGVDDLLDLLPLGRRRA